MDVNTGTLRRALTAAGIDPASLRIAGEQPPAAPDSGPVDALLLTGSDRTGQWYLKGSSALEPGWPGVLAQFPDEATACRRVHEELTQPNGTPFAEERAAWANTTAALRARAEQDLAATHPTRAEQRRLRDQGLPLTTRAELDAALKASGSNEPYHIDHDPADPWTEDSDPLLHRWPTDVFAFMWDQFDELWVTGMAKKGLQPDIHLRFTDEADACGYVFELLTRPPSLPQRLTAAQWHALHADRRVRPE
ncbi:MULTISPECIES: hypothetical protein [Streptacidiphilus]|uniref:DUF317 domain-containing protein n=1 Tax=Streptacidiphilus cavernicola TaxID=3342716 RepID=A0ABV6UGV4_9ACTN|nr:hypothetical protein [Streptacidiphilus jeojiense]